VNFARVLVWTHATASTIVCLKLYFENNERRGGTVLSPLMSDLEKGLKMEFNKTGDVSIT